MTDRLAAALATLVQLPDSLVGVSFPHPSDDEREDLETLIRKGFPIELQDFGGGEVYLDRKPE